MVRIITDSFAYAISFLACFLIVDRVLFGVRLRSVSRWKVVVGYLLGFVVCWVLDFLSKYTSGYKPSKPFWEHILSEMIVFLTAGAVIWLVYIFWNRFWQNKN